MSKFSYLYDISKPASQPGTAHVFREANNHHKETLGTAFRSAAADTYGFVTPIEMLKDPASQPAFLDYMLDNMDLDEQTKQSYINADASVDYSAFKEDLYTQHGYKEAEKLYKFYLATLVDCAENQQARYVFAAFTADPILIARYAKRYGPINPEHFNLVGAVNILKALNAEVDFDNDDFLASIYDADLMKNLYQWKHGESQGSLRGLILAFAAPDAFDEMERADYHPDRFRDTLSSLMIGALIAPYMLTKDFQNRHLHHYIQQGCASPLFSLYLINPLKFIEFSVRLLENICIRLVQLGATTDPNDPHMIAELGWIRSFLQLSVTLIFALPKFAASLIGSPDSVFNSSSALINAIFTNQKGQLNFFIAVASAYLYFALWATCIAQASFFLTAVVPALQAGTALTSPAMLNLLFGGTTQSIILNSAFNSFGIYLAPLFASLLGYDYRPADARYNYLIDKQENDIRNDEKAHFSIASLLDPEAAKRKAGILDGTRYVSDLKELEQLSPEYAAKFSDKIADFDAQLLDAIKDKKLDKDTHRALSRMKLKLGIHLHPDKNAEVLDAATKGWQIIEDKFSVYQNDYELAQLRSQAANPAGFFMNKPKPEYEEQKPAQAMGMGMGDFD